MVAAKSTRNAARKAAAATRSASTSIQLQLRIIAVELRCSLSVITVAAHALRDQNADIDTDAATVLQRGASAPIHACLERIEALLSQPTDPALPRGRRPPRAIH